MATESPTLVSCIMPTANRPQFVPGAVACFLGQDYAARELIVLDNGAAPIEDLLPVDPRIRYLRADPGGKLGALRNAACEAAKGEIIVHWDDDDWYPPNRISRQVACLTGTGADLCGSSQIHFIDTDGQRAWTYRSHPSRPWFGSTLAYRRTLWRERPFDAVQVGEDTRFVMRTARQRVVDLADPGLCVAAVHAGNTSPKRAVGSEWIPASVQHVLGLRGDALRPALPVPTVSSAPAQMPAPMPRVCIGIHARGDAARLNATLRHLALHTPAAAQCLLLIDGDDADLRAGLSNHRQWPVSATDDARGAPACFNRLLREADADVYVFLESGSLVGPGWLGHLLAALAADDSHGLAGPTTNLAWSVQGEWRGRGATARNVDEIAQHLALRSTGQWQNLAPRHSLADFCYAVRREVVQLVGGASEDYGHGPCWEIDYTVRASRAGFASVWARAAYVFRMPFTPQRQRDEAALMAASKALFQRTLCGRMLDGSRAHVVADCRGDSCRHFAPPALIRVHRPLAATPLAQALQADPIQREPRPDSPHRPADSAAVETPLVSCIVPTGGRLPWLLQSIRYFQRQDYPSLELVIVDDGPQDVSQHLPPDPRIRYVHRPRMGSIGAKRNLACEMVRGAFIAHWDDDDWYGVSRLSAQMTPLLAGQAEISAFDGTPFFDVSDWRFWRCTPALFARLFRCAVHGGTLVYARSVFGAGRFASISLGEDAHFLQTAVQRGSRLCSVPSADHFIYVRHGSNAWRFTCGRHVDSVGWTRIEPPPFALDDLPFYRQVLKPATHPA
jgi:glycosyltransferase involved in cell wall biosynthesis